MSETVKTGRAVRQSHFVAPPEVAAPGETDAVKLDQAPTSMWTDAWRDLRKRPLFIISTIIILAVIVIAAFPGLFTSTDPRPHLQHAGTDLRPLVRFRPPGL